MWFERVKSAIQEKFPGAIVNVEINDKYLTIGVIGTDNDKKTATSMLFGALDKVGALAHFSAIVFNLHKSREDWVLLELRRITGDNVRVRLFGTTLEVSVCSHFNSSVDKQLQPLFNELVNIYGASIISIRYPGIDSGVVPSSYDDDDSDENPNWPSTTGNPSGGGRGNNPPHR